MNDRQKGMEIIRDTILNNKTHQDYTRVTSLAKEYLQIFTGEDLADLLKPYHTKTSAEMFEQVVAVYQSTMPEMANNLAKVFSKIFRSNRVFSSVETKAEGARDEILNYLSTFWQGESEGGLDAYITSRWFYFQRFDPNAFVAIEFEDVNDVTKKTNRVFPVEFPCNEAVRFNYVNGTLDWLLIKKDIKYRVKAGDTYAYKDGSRYILYLEDYIIRLTQVDPALKLTTASDQDAEQDIKNTEEVKKPVYITIEGTAADASKGNFGSSGNVYLYEEFVTNAGKVPAKRIGYELDPKTNQRTCVSIFHPARSRFKKELKAGSELDLSVAAHLHPQKIQFADPCEAEDCKEGLTTEGQVCQHCHGSGMKSVSTSAQDVILVRRPRAGDPFPDLTKYVHYIKPDIEVIQFLYTYVDEIAEKAKRAIFGGQAVEKKVINKTATEMDYSMDDVYDTLHPFAKSYSSFWKFAVNMTAIYSENDSEDLKIYHSFPTDFKLKTLGMLMEERKSAKDSDIPQYIIEAIDRDIAEILYADDQNTLTKINTKARFNPFAGKTQPEIAQIILQNKTTKFNQVLYSHFNTIFTQIEQDYKSSNSKLGEDAFYLLPYEKQKAEIDKRVKQIIADIDKENNARLELENSFKMEGD